MDRNPKCKALSQCCSPSSSRGTMMKVTPFSYLAGRKKVYIFPVLVAAVATRLHFGSWRRKCTISAWNMQAHLFQSFSLTSLISSTEGLNLLFDLAFLSIAQTDSRGFCWGSGIEDEVWQTPVYCHCRIVPVVRAKCHICLFGVGDVYVHKYM